MKTLRLMLAIALLAVCGVATANNYDYYAQDEVVIGEESPVISDEAVPAPTVESYGVMPSWSNGCCEQQCSKADHLWDNYCYEKNCHLFPRGCGCCEKTFCGTGPFAKDCCKGGCAPSFHLPKLNVWNKCCQKGACVTETVKGCAQKCHRPQLLGKCCQKASCGKGCAKSVSCRKPLLSHLKLFRGCHGGKCGKGKGMEVGTTVNYDDGIPSPAVDGMIIEEEMPNDVPPAPSIADPAA